MEGTTFGNVPLNCEVKLEVWDSPNSAGVVIDAVRCAKLALDRGISGSLTAPSSYFMKSPPLQYTDSEAEELTEAFIAGRETPKIKPRKAAAKIEKPKVAIELPTSQPRVARVAATRVRKVPAAKNRARPIAELKKN
jgi:myo-inositol-1-phosphate synthase